MAQASTAREPSMEEILASIRRIIESNDTGHPGAAKPQLTSVEGGLSETEQAPHADASMDDIAPAVETDAAPEKPLSAIEPAKRVVSAPLRAAGAIPASAQSAPGRAISLADVAARLRGIGRPAEPAMPAPSETAAAEPPAAEPETFVSERQDVAEDLAPAPRETETAAGSRAPAAGLVVEPSEPTAEENAAPEPYEEVAEEHAFEEPAPVADEWHDPQFANDIDRALLQHATVERAPGTSVQSDQPAQDMSASERESFGRRAGLPADGDDERDGKERGATAYDARKSAHEPESFARSEAGRQETFATDNTRHEAIDMRLSDAEGGATTSALIGRGALISTLTGEKVAAAFDDLNDALLRNRMRALDDIAEEIMRPLLKEWLDDNLPTLVERLVREEIERVARGGRA